MLIVRTSILLIGGMISNYSSDVDATVRKKISIEPLYFENIKMAIKLPVYSGRAIFESLDEVQIQYPNAQTINLDTYNTYGEGLNEFKEKRATSLADSSYSNLRHISGIKIDGLPAMAITYDTESDKGSPAQVDVYFVIKGSKGYQILFVTDSDKSFMSKNQILDSIELKQGVKKKVIRNY